MELNVDEEKSPLKGGEVLEPDEGEGAGRRARHNAAEPLILRGPFGGLTNDVSLSLMAGLDTFYPGVSSA